MIDDGSLVDTVLLHWDTGSLVILILLQTGVVLISLYQSVSQCGEM